MAIPMDQRDGWIWMDGQVLPWKAANVHVLTHGLHYASSVFEGARAYGGDVFKLNEHTLRLFASASQIDVPIPFEPQAVDEAIKEIVAANRIVDGYIRPVVWRGSETLSAGAPNSKVSIAIACWPWPSYYPEEEKATGLSLTVGTIRRPPPECAFPQAKAAGGYMITTVEKHKALRAGFHDALLLDHEGYVAEASAANVFLVDGKDLATPIADRFLNGITRQTVIELARSLGFTVTERRIALDELPRCSECFLTGTASEITPVSSIDGHRFVPGPATKQIAAAYRDLVYARLSPAGFPSGQSAHSSARSSIHEHA